MCARKYKRYSDWKYQFVHYTTFKILRVKYTMLSLKKGQLTRSINNFASLRRRIFTVVPWIKTNLLRNISPRCEEIPPDWWIRGRWLVNCLVRSARTAADMSQDVCHRQRRSLNEFQSGRAKKTRAEHARIKSCGAGAAPREAPRSRARLPRTPRSVPPPAHT